MAVPAAKAQWVEENYTLNDGWNAIWISHDLSHDTIDNLVPASVEEIWRWNPNSSPTQFTENPAAPVQGDTQWLVWKNGFPLETTMTTFGANSAYLVKLADGTGGLTLSLTGKPVPPSYQWKSSGLNFFGFPMETPANIGTRNFETFLSYSTELSAGPDIFKYNGGPLTSNPVQVLAPLFEPVNRNQAYWIRSSNFSDYYGPLRVTIASSGFDFGETGNVLTMKIANVTTNAVDATISQRASAAPAPSGPPIAGQVPLQVRGGINPTTGQFDYTSLAGSVVFNLAAGEEIEIALAVDRATMGGNPGDVAQGLLEITDSFAQSRIDLPVRAVTTSRGGLWIGTAMVNQVDQITAAPDSLLTDEEREEDQGPAVANTEANAAAPSTFPIRLIFHQVDGGNLTLLQQVYIGKDGGDNTIITDKESLLDPNEIASARRLSTALFPLDAKVTGSGSLGLSGTASLQVNLPFDDPTNPFVHTFHPDHDNLVDGSFPPASLPEGDESYTVTRDLDLTFVSDPTTLGVTDLGWGSTVLGGTYSETISGLRAQDINVQGSFILKRISDIGTLTE